MFFLPPRIFSIPSTKVQSLFFLVFTILCHSFYILYHPLDFCILARNSIGVSWKFALQNRVNEACEAKLNL